MKREPLEGLKRILCTLLAAVLITGSTLPAATVTAKAADTEAVDAETADTENTDAETTQVSTVRDVIIIASAEDLVELAKNCSLDVWSVDKYIELSRDIDVSGSEFTGIPIFSGEFNGNGHTISGLDLEGRSVNNGFMGIITESGIVRDLNLSGKVDPDGIVESVGGLASQNYGDIENCMFLGSVINTTYISEMEASQITGGLVGVNEQGGRISGSYVSGEVSGLKYTGGIAGQNYGMIIDSHNEAVVNIATKDKKVNITDLKSAVTSIDGIDDVKRIINYKKEYASENTGGITGYNAGNILSCNNTAKVGTSRNGYNVGGIAGRNAGYIYNCSNSGEIKGNKNVGGVVGQLEPYVRIEYDNMLLEDPKSDIDGAFDIVNDTLGDIGTDVNDVSSSVSDVLSHVNTSLDICTELEDTLTDAVNVKVEEVDGMVGTVNDEIDAVNQLLNVVHQVTAGLKNVSAGATSVTSHLKDGMGELQNTSSAVKDLGSKASDQISTLINKDTNTRNITVQAQVGSILITDYDAKTDDEKTAYLEDIVKNTIVKLLRNGTSYTQGRFAASSITSLNDGTSYTFYAQYEFTSLPIYDSSDTAYEYDALIYNSSDATKVWALNPLKTSESVRVYELSGSANYCNLVINWEDNNDQYGIRPSELIISAYYNGQLISTNAYSRSDTGIYTIDVGTKNYSAMTADEKKLLTFKLNPIDYYSIGDMTQDDNGENKTITCTYDPSETSQSAKEIANDISVIMTDTFEGISDLTEAISSLHEVTTSLKSTTDTIHAMGMPQLSKFPQFSQLPDTIDTDVSRLLTEVQAMVTAIDGINGSLNTTQLDLTSNLQDLTGQANLITDNIFEIVSSVPETLESFLNDDSGQLKAVSYSEVDNHSICGGTILDCHNKGRVIGITVVGGVAGTMALAGVPVIDVGDKEEGSIALPQITYQATVSGCDSIASVCSEQDYVAMICGKIGLGSVTDCTGYGRAYSLSGNYVGGVAGKSSGKIQNCQIKGNLEGEYYVGGIIGIGVKGNALLGGSDVQNCYSSINIDDPKQFSGAIAGDAIGEFSDNYFYSEDLNGVNGYSIKGSYEPVSDDSMKNAYDIEKDKVVSFEYKGQVVDVIAVGPGENLLKEDFPDPQGGKYFTSFWQSGSLYNITADTVVYGRTIPTKLTIFIALGVIALLVLLGILRSRRISRHQRKVASKFLTKFLKDYNITKVADNTQEDTEEPLPEQEYDEFGEEDAGAGESGDDGPETDETADGEPEAGDAGDDVPADDSGEENAEPEESDENVTETEDINTDESSSDGQ